MKLINGQNWINLENHLDMTAFDAMNDQIVYAIAKNAKYIEPSYTPGFTLFDRTRGGFIEESSKNKKQFLEFDTNQLNWYTKLQGASTLGNHLILQGNMGYPASFEHKHLSKNSIILPAANDFNFLFDWIKNQNCFTDYGRTMFWINEPNQITATHTDYGNVDLGNRDMFIWLTGRYPKTILLSDNETKEIHETNTRALVFNTVNWHGSKGHRDCVSWSLRIDGSFNPDWAEKVGIREYYKL